MADPTATTLVDVGIIVLILDRFITLAKTMIDAYKEKQNGNPSKFNGASGEEQRRIMNKLLEEMAEQVDEIHTSVVAPDRQPIHVLVKELCDRERRPRTRQ